MAKTKAEKITSIEEQFKTFLEQTVMTEHSCRILDGLTAQNAVKAAHTAQESSAGGGCGARVTDIRSEAGRGYSFQGLVERYCSIPVEIFSFV